MALAYINVIGVKRVSVSRDVSLHTHWSHTGHTHWSHTLVTHTGHILVLNGPHAAHSPCRGGEGKNNNIMENKQHHGVTGVSLMTLITLITLITL